MKTLTAEDIAKVTDARESTHPESRLMEDGTGRVYGMRTTCSVELNGEWQDIEPAQFDDVCVHLEGLETTPLSPENDKLRGACEELPLSKHGQGHWLAVGARRAIVSDAYAGTRPRLVWHVHVYAPAGSGTQTCAPVSESHGFTARDALERYGASGRTP